MYFAPTGWLSLTYGLVQPQPPCTMTGTSKSRTDASSATPAAPPSDRNDKEFAMSAHEVRSELSVKAVEVWLVDELAGRLELRTSEIDVDRYFDEFDLDPSEAPIPARKLKSWLGFELDMTVLWRHPTIASLAQHIVDEIAERAMPDPIHTDRARAA